MAIQMLNLVKTFQKLSVNSNVRFFPSVANNFLTKQESPVTTVTRNTHFYTKLPANRLWKGITSVSNAGKKRGRGKNVSKKNIKDLNRGQIIGVGKANIQFPGLTTSIIRGKEVVEQHQLPEDLEREKRLVELRNQMGNIKRAKLSPLERGWSGSKMPGRSIGSPDTIGEDTFEGFDTKVLELKTVFNMKGNLGRKRRIASFVVTGNGNGLVGFAIGKATESRVTLKKAKNRAAQKLMYIKIFRGHSIHHDFFQQFGKTKVFVKQRPEGHGLICHRAIKTVCEVIGIKDIYAKVEGSTNVQHVVKAFVLGLIRQKTHRQIAEEKRLHLVELCKENDYFPTVLASPTVCRKADEIEKDETLDFTQYCLDGKVILQRKKFPPFFTKHAGWKKYLIQQEYTRNQFDVKIQLKAEYGELRSFLTEKYPDARHPKAPKKNKDEADDE